MLNPHIQQKILSVLNGYVLSTSMVAKKANLSRITVAKYLAAMQSRNMVQAVNIGKAVAWRAHELKPLVAIIAKPGTARMVKLALGDKYGYMLTTNPTLIRDAFVLITDNVLCARTAQVPVVLVGGNDEDSYCLPELFDTGTLKVLIKKIYYEQNMPTASANAQIVIEHFEEFEDVVGIHRADELIKLTVRMLRDSRVPFKQFERTTFLVEGSIPEETLIDIEQTFHVILAHVYGRMVQPGEQISEDSIIHNVPCLTITLAEEQFEEELER